MSKDYNEEENLENIEVIHFKINRKFLKVIYYLLLLLVHILQVLVTVT